MKKETIGYVIVKDHADGDTYYYTGHRDNGWIWAGPGGIRKAYVFNTRKAAKDYAKYGRCDLRIIRYFRWKREDYARLTHKQLAKLTNDLERSNWHSMQFIKMLQRNERLRKKL